MGRKIRLGLIGPGVTYDVCRNAFGVVSFSNRMPKVGAGAPTLGFEAQSRWDCFLQTFLKAVASIPHLPFTHTPPKRAPDIDISVWRMIGFGQGSQAAGGICRSALGLGRGNRPKPLLIHVVSAGKPAENKPAI